MPYVREHADVSLADRAPVPDAMTHDATHDATQAGVTASNTAARAGVAPNTAVPTSDAADTAAPVGAAPHTLAPDPSARAGHDHAAARMVAVAYSESRERLRRRCPRAYFHSVYTARGGWSAAAGTDAFWAYRCKASTPLAAAVGQAVHAAATRCVLAVCADLALPSFAVLRTAAGRALNAICLDSWHARARFLRSPRAVHGFFLEALYEVGPTRDALAAARVTLDLALTNLLALDELWHVVRAAGRDGVWSPDAFHAFWLPVPGDVGDARAATATQCFAAPDLAVRERPDTPLYVIDFKCGDAGGVIDQLLTYSLAAQHARWCTATESVIGVVASLGTVGGPRAAPVRITPDEVEEARARIVGSVREMRAWDAVVATAGPSPVDVRDVFPQRGAPHACPSCAFRGLCWPREYPLQPTVQATVQVAVQTTVDTARHRAVRTTDASDIGGASVAEAE